MAEKRKFGRALRWTIAGGVGLLFHVGLYWGVYGTMQPDQQLERTRMQFTKIKYFDSQARDRSLVLDQQMTLFDPKPMLLPTEWNAASTSRLREFIQEEEGIFEPFGPMFELAEGNYIDDFGNVPAAYGQLSAAQSDFDFTLFAKIGRKELPLEYELEAGLDLSVKETGTGRQLGSAAIYNSAVEALDEEWPEWGPAVFVATVENGFRAAGLAVLRSSGFDEVDAVLRRQAELSLPRFGQLSDGVYLLEITP